MRIPVRFVETHPERFNQRLYRFYMDQGNYRNVQKEVKRWFTYKKNTCTAYMSTALRMVGLPVPIGEIREGFDVSMVTNSLSAYLQGDLGWMRIDDPEDLQAGDIVFAEPEDSWPGVSVHTYMFAAWLDSEFGLGWVVDNQGHTHRRYIFGGRPYNQTPFWYALRAPE